MCMKHKMVSKARWIW